MGPELAFDRGVSVMRRFQKCYVIYLFFIHLHFYNYFYLCTQVLQVPASYYYQLV